MEPADGAPGARGRVHTVSGGCGAPIPTSARSPSRGWYLWSHRPLCIVLLGICGVVAANGIDDVALVVLSTDDLRAGEAGVALLLGGVGIGLLVGYAVLARGARHASMVVLLDATSAPFTFVVAGTGALVTAVALTLPRALRR